jgi:hypothetical protein
MIAVFGRKDIKTGILHNKSDGGQGKTGYIHTEEAKAKISEKVRGENHPLYGTSPSPETREKMSIALTGRVMNEETRRKMSEAHKGSKGTYGFLGKSHTEETLEKMKKPRSEETRRKMSEAQRRRWAAKKERNFDSIEEN